MADEFYQDMQDVASEILGEFAQGSIQLEQQSAAGAGDPARPWTPGAPSLRTWVLAGAMRTVDRAFVDGTLVVGTEAQATVAVRARRADTGAVESIDPMMGGTLITDGLRRVIKKVVRIPEVGTPVSWALIVDS